MNLVTIKCKSRPVTMLACLLHGPSVILVKNVNLGCTRVGVVLTSMKKDRELKVYSGE